MRGAGLADARPRLRHPRPRGRALPARPIHQQRVPACRAYVLSLRGLAAVLPPVPRSCTCVGAGAAPRAAPRHRLRARRVPGRARVGGAGAGGAAGPPAPSGGPARRRRHAAGLGCRWAGAERAGCAGGGWLLAGGRSARSSPSAACSRWASARAAWRSLRPPHARGTPVTPPRARTSARRAATAAAERSAQLARRGAARAGSAPAASAAGASARAGERPAALGSRRQGQPRVRARAGVGAGRLVARPPRRRRARPREAATVAGSASAARPRRRPRGSGAQRNAPSRRRRRGRRSASSRRDQTARGPREFRIGPGPRRSAAREDLAQPPQRERVAARAQPAGGDRAQRVQALADDVHPVLVGDAQAQVRAERLALLDGARAVVDGQVPGGDVGVGELPLEGGRSLEPVRRG